jgi:fructuronate reductase
MKNTNPHRLTPNARGLSKPGLIWPAYEIDAVTTGIVHIGPGAFFRGHMAVYADDLLARDPSWGICAVSLKSAGVSEALVPQDNLYVLAELDRVISYRVIGAVRETLVAARNPDLVFDCLGDPKTRVVSLTITEKGYCLDAAGRLDRAHPDILHDLANPKVPASAIGWLVFGLQQRFAKGIAPFAVLSCDNLNNNGGKLRQALIDFAAVLDPALSAWIDQNLIVPRTMVDSITPATDDALRARIVEECGLYDAWPIQRETFRQFVVEDIFAGDVPDLASVGAELTRDVSVYESAKLRLLNGAHSTLAYLGLLAGFETVFEAMSNPELSGLVEALMVEDIAPTLASSDMNVSAYIADVLARFLNPAIKHLLSQIAWDGSKKLPIRLLDTVKDAIGAGRSTARLALPVAAWIRFIVTRARDQIAIIDPMADRLTAIAAKAVGKGAQDVPLFFNETGIFPDAITHDAAFKGQVIAAYDNLVIRFDRKTSG